MTIEQNEHDTFEIAEDGLVVKETWESDDYVKITCGQSKYAAHFVNGIMYGDLIFVPVKDRNKGIATKLLQRSLEIAKEHNINEILHHFQSLEGLMLITKRFKDPNRKYFLPTLEEVSLDEAIAILKQKSKDAFSANDTRICIVSSTYIDQLK